MHKKRKEPYAGGDFYGKVMNLVAVTTYIPKSIRERYKAAARRLSKTGRKVSAQMLRLRVLVKNAPKR